MKQQTAMLLVSATAAAGLVAWYVYQQRQTKTAKSAPLAVVTKPATQNGAAADSPSKQARSTRSTPRTPTRPSGELDGDLLLSPRSTELVSIASRKIRDQQILAKLGKHNTMSNELLARKLLANPMFELELPVPNEFEKRVLDISKQALWDIIREESTTVNSFERLLNLVIELKVRLSSLTPNRQDIIASIDENIDIDLINQQLKNKAFDYDSLNSIVTFVIKLIRNLESPARNDVTDQWLKFFFESQQQQGEVPPKDYFDLLRVFFDFCHKKLDYIALDTANYQLRLLGPSLQEHGIEYIRSNFEERMENRSQSGQNPLQQTETFIRQSLEYELSVASPAGDYSVDLEQLKQQNSSAISIFHRVSIFQQIIWNIHLHDQSVATLQDTLPETMIDEAEAVFKLYKNAKALCLSAFCIMRMRQCFAKVKLVLEHEDKLFLKLHSILVSSVDVSVTDIPDTDGRYSAVTFQGDVEGTPNARYVSDRILEYLKANVALEHEPAVLAEVEQCVLVALEVDKHDDKVYGLVIKRLNALSRRYLAHIKADSTDSQIIEQKSAVHSALSGLGLQALTQEVLLFLTDIIRFAARDVTIHAARYNSIIARQASAA